MSNLAGGQGDPPIISMFLMLERLELKDYPATLLHIRQREHILPTSQATPLLVASAHTVAFCWQATRRAAEGLIGLAHDTQSAVLVEVRLRAILLNPS